MKKLSIVIPVFNKLAFTKKTLNDLVHLQNKEIEDDVEIIVIDNASTDDTNAFLTSWPNGNTTWYRYETNQGFAKACNRGFDISQGDVVLFLNNDVKISPEHKNDWIKPILDELEKHPDAIVSPTAGLVDPNNEFRFVHETKDPSKTFNYLSGWCIAAKRETWEKLRLPKMNGPWDESFYLYFEDTSLGFHAKELDIPMRMVRIEVQHIGKVSSSQLNTAKWYNISRKIFLEKWGKTK